jgi:hypothetical protein
MAMPKLVQGAANQSWKTDNPRVLLRLILDHASDPHHRSAVYAEFVERSLGKNDRSKLFVNIVDYWFDNNYRSAVRSYSRDEERESQAAKAEEHEREVAQRRAAIEVVVNKRADEKAMLLLKTMMPIGKAFGDCTGSELRSMRQHLPKALDKVIAKVGDNVLVRSVFTNKALARMGLRLV